eukprot:7605433-Ditylum_brightwellii.AAC.1
MQPPLSPRNPNLLAAINKHFTVCQELLIYCVRLIYLNAFLGNTGLLHEDVCGTSPLYNPTSNFGTESAIIKCSLTSCNV